MATVANTRRRGPLLIIAALVAMTAAMTITFEAGEYWVGRQTRASAKRAPAKQVIDLPSTSASDDEQLDDEQLEMVSPSQYGFNAPG